MNEEMKTWMRKLKIANTNVFRHILLACVVESPDALSDAPLPTFDIAFSSLWAASDTYSRYATRGRSV